MNYQIHSGGVYHIRYHFVWCPKCRRPSAEVSAEMIGAYIGAQKGK